VWGSGTVVTRHGRCTSQGRTLASSSTTTTTTTTTTTRSEISRRGRKRNSCTVQLLGLSFSFTTLPPLSSLFRAFETVFAKGAPARAQDPNCTLCVSRAFLCTCVRARARVRVYDKGWTNGHECGVHACMHICVCVCVCACARAHTHTHTYACAHFIARAHRSLKWYRQMLIMFLGISCHAKS